MTTLLFIIKPSSFDIPNRKTQPIPHAGNVTKQPQRTRRFLSRIRDHCTTTQASSKPSRTQPPLRPRHKTPHSEPTEPGPHPAETPLSPRLQHRTLTPSFAGAPPQHHPGHSARDATLECPSRDARLQPNRHHELAPIYHASQSPRRKPLKVNDTEPSPENRHLTRVQTHDQIPQPPEALYLRRATPRSNRSHRVSKPSRRLQPLEPETASPSLPLRRTLSLSPLHAQNPFSLSAAATSFLTSNSISYSLSETLATLGSLFYVFFVKSLRYQIPYDWAC